MMEERIMTSQNGIILIVDDEWLICKALSRLMQKEGFQALVTQDGFSAKKMLRTESPDVMLTDFRMPGMDGMELLKEARRLDPDLPVIMITAYADIPGAVEAMRAGAHDYLAKPFEHDEVIRVVRRALAERALKQRLKQLSNRLQEDFSLSTLMGPSDAVGRIICEVNRVARSDFTVVLIGETGSGKELAARAIHQASHRSGGPFIGIDCGAIPETLLESELFGHEKGAFTGAALQKPGKFEAAKGGTLFLDEISNMPLVSQVKLLRVLQEKKVYRVGGINPLDIDVRLIVSSNQDLETVVASGTFRQDLFYRLNEFTIKIPPLRERKEDIPYLAKRFLDITNVELNKSVRGISELAITTLLSYHWPGNVRQLRSTIRRAVLQAYEIITEKDLEMKFIPAFTPNIQQIPWKGFSFKEIMYQSIITAEREILVQALKYTGGNKAKAARLLKIDYKTIHTKVKQLGISVKGVDHGEKEG
jgi:DNA-binding NtrC family response regulator